MEKRSVRTFDQYILIAYLYNRILDQLLEFIPYDMDQTNDRTCIYQEILAMEKLR